MSELVVTGRAPSNIALIKYMGKRDATTNIPENPSISFTLHSLCTLAELSVAHRPGLSAARSSSDSSEDSLQWISEPPRQLPKDLPSSGALLVPALKDAEISRVFNHVERVRKLLPPLLPKFGLKASDLSGQSLSMVLRTANTFPAASGIASSASSFAAITLATAFALVSRESRFEEAWDREPEFRRALAQLSRLGSGSSCRSFEGPWVLWEEERAASVDASRIPELAHFVVVVRNTPKAVSSSQAHSRVRSSPLWSGRPERARRKIQTFLEALKDGQFPVLARIAWGEAWEMHSLFHTSAEPFSYWEPGTLEVLQWLDPYVRDEDMPPMVTLDAGPNIHLIVQESQRTAWRERLQSRFPGYQVLEDKQGSGPSLVAVRGI